MMTIDEIRKCYGSSFDGYIECSDCPLSQKECNSEGMTGYEDCWKRIKIHMDERDRLCLEKHGHWEMVEEKVTEFGFTRNTGRKIPMCTNCKHADPEFKTYFCFCPDCGAKMDEESESNG